ncbi:MAG: ribonucleotide-diphosphate reductase subunit alpha, partial [Alphaproteobacteria bacterium]|nr:ribonucleotide-diphosphate reductase subunit alpha [Alphaproteobacteria bacterium]
KGKNDESTWTSILHAEGSVQHLNFLSQDEKDIFKTAFEIDQRWLVKLAAERQPYICQAQSLNLFLASNVHKRDLHQLHFSAWQLGLKSLYYLRSKSLQRPESARSEEVYKNFSADECLSCQ